MTARVLRSTAKQPNRELARAKARLAELERQTRAVIRVLTAEQALKAQRVVREAGRK